MAKAWGTGISHNPSFLVFWGVLMLATPSAARTLAIEVLSISPNGPHILIYYLSFIIVQKYIYDYACMGVALVSRFFFIAKTASCIRCTSLRAPAGLAHSLFWLVAVQFWLVAVQFWLSAVQWQTS